jgi:hypothetical protein
MRSRRTVNLTVFLTLLSCSLVASSQTVTDEERELRASISSAIDALAALGTLPPSQVVENCPPPNRCQVGGVTYFYSAVAAEEQLERIHQMLLAHIPESAGPLRDYVNRQFPVISPRVPDIDKDTLIAVMLQASELLNALRSTESFRVDLTVRSNPTEAAVELVSGGGQRLATTSDDELKNVWRGEYTYKYVKSGFSTATGTIDLIRDPRKVLECKLVEVGAIALPCHLTSDSSASPANK